jgi:hypothetical protein
MNKRIATALAISLLLLLLPSLATAQLILNKPQDTPLTELMFDPAAIKAARISSIKADLAMKPDNKVIDDKGLVQYHEFDSLGRLTRYSYTIINGTTTREIQVPALYRKGRVVRKGYTRTESTYRYDTISTNFYYDTSNRLIIKRTSTGDIYNAAYYTYDIKDGNIIKEVRCKETNTSENRNEFRLGVQTVTSLETFEYEKPAPTQVKKKCFNDEGRIYRQVIVNYDAKGNKTDEYSEYVVTWMNASSAWEYNDKGWLVEKNFTTNATGSEKESSVYEYDAKGNLTAEKRFKNDMQINEIGYLYDENGVLLRSQVNRDIPNKQIGIIKYSYGFYK